MVVPYMQKFECDKEGADPRLERHQGQNKKEEEEEGKEEEEEEEGEKEGSALDGEKR